MIGINSSIIFIVKADHHFKKICDVFSQHNLQYPIFFSETPKDCLQIARKQVSLGAKVIVANYFLCELFQEYLSVSVIGIRRSSYPFLSCVVELLKTQDKVAFLARDGYAFGSAATEAQLVFPSKVYTYCFENAEQCQQLLYKLKNDGFQTVICPHWAGKIAEKAGLRYRCIPLLEKDILEAVHNAEFQLRVYEQRASNNMLISRILDMTTEGVAAIDPFGKIIDINQIACDLLHLGRESALGTDYDQTCLAKFRLEGYLINPQKTKGLIVMVGDEMLIYDIQPLFMNEKLNALVVTFNSARRIQESEQHIRLNKKKSGNTASKTFSSIIGSSKGIIKTIQIAKTYAKVDSTVLISAPSGCGKELFAQSIHNASIRAKEPFVVINCAAIPESVLESLLFGYVPGAFTGASKEGKVGLFELAHKGTIFLDEVSEMPLGIQARFLRVLQEKEVTPIGGNYSIPVEFRLLAATNRDLWNLVSQGKFREDLYHRIHVLTLEIPPLSQRKEDIAPLAQYFVYNRAKELELSINGISNGALNLLSNLNYTGNVRQLNNILERAMVLSSTNTITRDEVFNALPQHLRDNLGSGINRVPPSEEYNLAMKKQFYNRDLIIEALQKAGGNRTRAANLLGISTTTLWRRIKKQGLNDLLLNKK